MAEWNTQLPDQVLAFVDFLSMAHSVEIRSPFLDWRLVEFAASLPDRLKIRKGVVKAILKEALAPVLPAGVLARPKEGFVLPVLDWLPHSLHAFATATLAPERIGRLGSPMLGPTPGRLTSNPADGPRTAAVRLPRDPRYGRTDGAHGRLG